MKVWRLVMKIPIIGWMFIFMGPGIGWGNTELPNESVLSLAVAQKAANAALAKCEEGGYQVSVAGMLKFFFVVMEPDHIRKIVVLEKPIRLLVSDDLLRNWRN